MIILPDRNIPCARLLLPVKPGEWCTPSQGQVKDQFDNENCTRFRVRARLNDGHIIWRGWFDDREDFDAFLWAIATGELWRGGSNAKFLPTPFWPGLDPAIGYDFATVTFLTSPTGSTQTGTSPSDWANSNNQIEAIGAGASGALMVNATGHATGGGAGAWNKTTNFNFSAPGTTQYKWLVSAGGAGLSQASSANGNDGGGDTWFGNASATNLASSAVGSKFGIKGVQGAGSQNGGAGGTGSSGVGSSSNNGGAGGNLTGASGSGGSGGGGAAGSTGAGNQGDSSSGTGSVITAGGSGDAGSGGGQGTAGNGAGTPGGVGGNGTEWDSSHGSGGGGGGNQQTASAGVTAGAGGNYGAGGGGARSGTAGTSTSGAGIQGIIVITYTPSLGFPFQSIPFTFMLVR